MRLFWRGAITQRYTEVARSYTETFIKNFLCVTLCVLWVSLCCSCSERSDQTKANTPIHTLIFMDKSLSLNTNQAYAAQKYDGVLNAIVANNIRATGDRITVYFIHENTAKARALSLVVRSEMDDVGNASPTDAETAEMTFELSIQREKTRFKKQLQSKLAQINKALSNQRTDVLASIPLIADAGADGQAVKVYYLSDMVESMVSPGDGSVTRRDFHKNPPANEAQADEWAKNDAKLFDAATLGSPQIYVALPFEPTASRRVNNPLITRYWQTMFGALGVEEVKEL